MAKKIWIIDDDDGILDGFQAMLESEGFEIKTSLSSDILQEITKENMPDLILLDVLLSGIDGREICKQMKQNETTKHIPIVMLSAAPNVKKAVKEAGADDFISKPFEMKDLLSMIEKYAS